MSGHPTSSCCRSNNSSGSSKKAASIVQYGQVADVGIGIGGGGGRGSASPNREFDPWDQLRMQTAKGDAAALTAARKSVARTTFKPSIRSKSHPLISHCRKIMREQARKREGVMRVEGVKLILTALEYGWVPDVVLCAAELSKAAPELRDDGALTVGTAEVVSCALMQPRLDPAIAIGSPPRMRPRHRPERAMLLGVQDPSNLGSLLRTGAALGVTTVSGLPVLCADAHDGAPENMQRVQPSDEEEDGWILALVHVESLGVAAAGAILLDRLTARVHDDV
eukprot:gene17551-29505_t